MFFDNDQCLLKNMAFIGTRIAIFEEHKNIDGIKEHGNMR